METKGIEPSFPRCDRGVLPLHHVPETTFGILILLNIFSEFNFFLAVLSKSSKVPLLVANDFLNRLTLWLRFTVGRITYSHQLDDGYTFGDG